MADTNDVQALSKISSEVDDSQIKIYLSSQCIKAQAFLFEKLRKQTNTQREIFKHIRNSNSKLEVEIKNADEEIKSLLLATNTVKSANVELKKELLLAKENKEETIERIRKGTKKYEALWLQCKIRYESIPHVQKWLTSTNKLQTLNEKVAILTNESNILSKDIDNKKKTIAKTDQDRIIKLANYIVYERPNSINLFKQKIEEINKLKKEIEEYSCDKNRKSVIIEMPAKIKEVTDSKEIHTWPNLYKNINDDSLMMPKLHLKNIDLDGLSAKLDQIKRTNSNCSPLKRSEDISHDIDLKRPKIDNTDYFSTYFKESFDNESNIDKDYSKKKLINILEDVKLDDKDTFNIISKANPDKFHSVEEIKANDGNYSRTDERIIKDVDNNSILKRDTVVDTLIIEEVDMTSNTGNTLIIPPTQYLDLSQERTSKSDSLPIHTTQQVEVMVHKTMDETPEKLIKDSDNKKKVSFDLPSIKDTSDKQNDSDKMNESSSSQMNISTTSEHSFMNIKNMILKEHNLDLSPQFLYSKNNLQKITSDDLTVTSKFFKKAEVNVSNTNDGNIKITEVKEQFDEALIEEITDDEMKEDNIVVSSPKSDAVNRQVSGLLFSHGPGNIPDSLNVSLSTAGYDEQDIDYQCIDSSVLLSPKADISMPIPTETEEVTSQEVPNFLSGLRKTGLSFFSKMALESKPDSAGQSGFNFNFGNDDKKARGGLFSMFR